jgi:adenine-specific DNA-methyltransferase
MPSQKPKTPKSVQTFTHGEEKRRNIPTAEFQALVERGEADPLTVAYERRNRDLDPQLIWRGKDIRDWSDLVVPAPPLYIQEKVHPKVLIDDLKRVSQESRPAEEEQLDLFGDFNGVPEGADKTDFYAHDQNWSNRMILGDSLQVMASLAEREGLRGKVQCIYFDPPYGIKFNSNFQWSTNSNKVTDGKADHITREPEQVKAFRDTWRDGIHSYLSYLRDRFTLIRDLLNETGSFFVQIGEENVHRVRSILDEVFGVENFCSLISFETTTGQTSKYLAQNNDFIIWYAKNSEKTKFRQLNRPKIPGEEGGTGYRFVLNKELTERSYDGRLTSGDRVFMKGDATSQRQGRPSGEGSAMHFAVKCENRSFEPRGGRGWSTTQNGMERLLKANRLMANGINLAYRRFLDDSPTIPIVASWRDTGSGFMSDKVYVVQTNTKVIERCILMTTDPGDLVLDPTCGSGTTAYVAEQWGRRWITIDTSRVALALARARIMGARYPYYLLADSREGQKKEADLARTIPSSQPVNGDIRHGFVYERVPHITLKSIANNTEIDVIWDRFQEKLEPIREKLNQTLGTAWEEWEIPRDLPRINTNEHESKKSNPSPAEELAIRVNSCPFVVDLHKQWWELRIARQKEIDASIAAKADFEYLYDKPYEDKKTVRVAGPFTVESLSPHRVLGLDENDELIDTVAETGKEYGKDYVGTILDTLRGAGVQQAHKQDKIDFFSLQEWPGRYVCAEGRYTEGNKENGKTKRAAIFIGPEFGTVTRVDLVTAAREAAEGGFDLLIACAFSYEAHTTDFNTLGGLPVLKATMNADLHMAGELKNTGKGNLFVIFGEPDIEIHTCEDGQLQVEVKGVDVFHPNTGEIRSDGPEGIACWFLDTDYNEESFFVRHAYFLGQNDPYKSLKTTLKAEINEEAWCTLNSPLSRPFPKPQQGHKIAVKIINHLGDEVMKVFRV